MTKQSYHNVDFQKFQNTGEDLISNPSHQIETTPDNSTLGRMHAPQYPPLNREGSKPIFTLSKIAAAVFVSGLFAMFVFMYFIHSHFICTLMFAMAFCITLLGAVCLMREPSKLKPLIAGSFLATLAFFGMIFGIFIIRRSVESIDTYMNMFIIGLGYVIFALPTSVASVCAIFRRKNRWAVLGSWVSIVLGIMLILFSPFFVVVAIVSVFLLHMSDDEFTD